MRDNLPNYLNMHNIDPGRIEPARIDAPPGNDSIRPDRKQATQQTEMTLETAIEILKFVEGNIYERIAIRKVIEALGSADDINVARKDLITGLVPCGCGGRAKQEDFFDGFFYFGAIKCPGCEIEIRIPSLTPEESSDRVKVAWNRAMDWKSGADITPMSGEVCK